ncbi:MAG: hypothetical protein HZB43_01660 [candidate division Zixibacteria bacterium]|nr:hypothetical protein [candidate division Zixibacteria bacterium]
MVALLSITAAACMIWAVVAGLMAIHYCQVHGTTVNPVLLRWEVLRCLSIYRKLTRESTGHVGPLFYHYLVPINAALVLVIIGLIVKIS